MSEFHRSFYSANAAGAALRQPVIRSECQNAAEYSLTIPVAYIGFDVNPFGHDPARTQIKGNGKRARALARSHALRRAGADFYAARRSRPASRPAGLAAGRATGTGEFYRTDKQKGATPLPVRSHIR